MTEYFSKIIDWLRKSLKKIYSTEDLWFYNVNHYIGPQPSEIRKTLPKEIEDGVECAETMASLGKRPKI